MFIFPRKVLGFNKSLAKLGGKSPVQVVSAELKKRGYSCQALVLDHNDWVNVNRARVFMWGCCVDAGGKGGAIFVRDTLLEVMSVVGIRRQG